MTLICGIPNAGKTTYSQRFENVVHMDEVATKGHPMSRICEIISESEENVCVEGVFTTIHSRKQLADACPAEWKKTCIWLDTPLEECLRRENRGRSEGLMRNCYACMQPPTYSEGWDEIIVIGENNGQCHRR